MCVCSYTHKQPDAHVDSDVHEHDTHVHAHSRNKTHKQAWISTVMQETTLTHTHTQVQMCADVWIQKASSFD